MSTILEAYPPVLIRDITELLAAGANSETKAALLGQLAIQPYGTPFDLEG